ncbi:hypothetical protein C8D88_10873 [Lentzea atacamensis]|uniref:Uncharacterized protein n=1 Tax=Lentzea atacamensis TaxID=531938 RepID=A0A316HUU1_9PSEU|nr:hypothetical protein C8D88_10873 [Lentzea atacamensis]
MQELAAGAPCTTLTPLAKAPRTRTETPQTSHQAGFAEVQPSVRRTTPLPFELAASHRGYVEIVVSSTVEVRAVERRGWTRTSTRATTARPLNPVDQAARSSPVGSYEWAKVNTCGVGPISRSRFNRSRASKTVGYGRLEPPQHCGCLSLKKEPFAALLHELSMLRTVGKFPHRLRDSHTVMFVTRLSRGSIEAASMRLKPISRRTKPGTTRAGCRPASRPRGTPAGCPPPSPQRIGARVLLLDAHDRVLLIHACDQPARPLPRLVGAARWRFGRRRGAGRRRTPRGSEETGSFFQRWAASCGSGNRHRIDHVFLTRAADAAPKVTLKPTENEKAD